MPRTTELWDIGVLRTESPRSQCWQGWAPSESWAGKLHPSLSQLLGPPCVTPQSRNASQFTGLHNSRASLRAPSADTAVQEGHRTFWVTLLSKWLCPHRRGSSISHISLCSQETVQGKRTQNKQAWATCKHTVSRPGHMEGSPLQGLQSPTRKICS